MSTLDEIERLKEQIQEKIGHAPTLDVLDKERVDLLGRKGALTALLRGLGNLDPEERAVIGKAANEIRAAAEALLEERKGELSAQALDQKLAAGRLDVTLPGRVTPLGAQHLISRIRDEIIDVFAGIGYSVAEGPEVELEFFNFTALNHSIQHPARSASDTFYLHDLSGDTHAGSEPSEVVLRTHTSPVQVRTMQHEEPPIYILAPGKVYRRDAADPTHLPQFTQMEGLVVDRDITFADLRGTLDYFVKEMFGKDRKTRFRPHFFPFTEPSAEVDVSCGICDGSGCRFCGNAGWIEILGCGMVDPEVFKHSGIDPNVYTGFAFGMGVDRIAALRYDIPDIRILIDGDMRFLRQF
ncbi:MAG: phenylalanine--tRNA ligase subunit alpha [Coriobacteriia bacterium]|nr:phenylalanine--tRNA ligase subunit alpha [Coriobacteriia bacterium]MCL2871055.1 phenylalanine--tRNA ligase subunit alpha [Coriobacteriia bacterium]